VVGTVANLKQQKRPLFFMDACRHADALWQSQFPDRSGGLHFVWVGEGVERKRVMAAISGLPPGLGSRIHFPGASTDVPRCLSAFDVFVLTSAYEGMPNALLEALSAELPCVATNVPGTCDVLTADGDVGILADPGDPAGFARAVFGLLCDTGRMETVGRNAQQDVRAVYSIERMVSSYAALFTRVLADGGKSR